MTDDEAATPAGGPAATDEPGGDQGRDPGPRRLTHQKRGVFAAAESQNAGRRRPRNRAAEMVTYETTQHPIEMSTDKPASARCNAITRDGTPCQKWPIGGAGEGRCRFHGGASTGPDEPATDHLENNDHAVDNDGGAPEGNTNAEVHSGFADWRKAYERFDEETREYVDRIAADWRETAAEHAPDVDADRRAELCREHATLSVLHRRTAADTTPGPDDSVPGRGFVIEEEREIGGETYTVRKANPALRAGSSLSRRQREIAEELRLYPGFQGDE